MNSLVEIFEASIEAKVSIVLTCGDTVLITQDDKSENLVKNTRAFVEAVNLLSSTHYGETCVLSVNDVQFKFLGGKFANNLGKLCKMYIQFNVLFSDTDETVEAKRIAKKAFFDYLDENVKNILDVVNVIKFVNKADVKTLANLGRTLEIKATNE